MMFFRLMLLIPLMRMFMLLEELTELSRTMSAEEVLRERREKQHRSDEQQRQQEIDASRKKQEKETQAKNNLIGLLPHEKKAALERLSRQNWPGGELGQVRNEAYRRFNSEPPYIEMALWKLTNGVHLGSDGNLWHDPNHVSIENSRFEPVDLDCLTLVSLQQYLLFIRALGT